MKQVAALLAETLDPGSAKPQMIQTKVGAVWQASSGALLARITQPLPAGTWLTVTKEVQPARSE